MKIGIFKTGSLTYGMADLIVEKEDVYYFLTLLPIKSTSFLYDLEIGKA